MEEAQEILNSKKTRTQCAHTMVTALSAPVLLPSLRVLISFKNFSLGRSLY